MDRNEITVTWITKAERKATFEDVFFHHHRQIEEEVNDDKVCLSWRLVHREPLTKIITIILIIIAESDIDENEGNITTWASFFGQNKLY